jgi:hypothetical protein
MISYLEGLKKSALAQAAAISALCIVIYLIGPISTYETNDDVAYSLIFAGKLISNVPDPHVTYINYVLANFIVSLYTFFPGIQWYGLFQVASVFISILFINYLFALTRHKNKLWLSSVFSIFCMTPFAFHIQFTKTAFILSTVGYLGMYIISEIDLPSLRQRIFLSSVATFFITTGFLLRRESFILATILCSFFIFSTFVKNKNNSRIAFALLALLILTSSVIHKYNYRGAWEDYIKIHYALKPLMENNDIKFTDNIEVFKKAGWSENDYFMFKLWAFSENKIYNVKSTNYILDNSRKTASDFKIINIKESLLEAVSGPAKNYIYTILLVSVAILFFYQQRGKKVFFCIFLPLALAIFIISYQGRLPTRVSVSAACFVPLAMLALSGEARSRRFFFVSGCIILSLVALPVYGQFKDLEIIAGIRKTENRDLHKLGSILAKTPATIVTWGAVFPYEGILPFESIEYLTGTSIIWLCGMNQSPIQNRMLAKQGINDVYTALVTQKTVFISMAQFQTNFLKKYYYEHYKTNIQANQVYTSNSFELYRVLLDKGLHD